MRRHLFSDAFNTVSYPGIFILWTANVLFFAAVYLFLSYIPGHAPTGLEGSLWMRIGDTLYYSMITATNTGYGDIVPQGLSKLFAALEAFSGLFLFAVFVGKLITRKQNVAIRHMHRTSFDSRFHDLREDLHIVRRDFNTIMKMVRGGEEITSRKWQMLRVAYVQVGGLLREVPLLYDAENHLYRIDARRERLLIEAFYRTLEKIEAMFDVFDEYNVNWLAKEKTIAELRELLNAFDDTLNQWKEEAVQTSGDLFEELLTIVERIRARLAEVYPSEHAAHDNR